MSKHNTRLIADVGGTNARFALVIDGKVGHERVLSADQYPDFSSAVKTYLGELATDVARPSDAAFAIAAPIAGDRVQMTNRSWAFSVTELRARFDFDRLIIINDFTALAMSLRALPKAELVQIGGKEPLPNTAIALIGPGTGLGVSGLIPYEQHWLPLQGEGGHVTVPVETDREAAIYDLLRKKFASVSANHVSAERLISGQGMVNLYEALCVLEGLDAQSLTPADVTKRALDRSSPACVEALEIFCAMLGTVAGNLVLTLGALGGVYIGGGIIPRFHEYFVQSQFRRRFEAKGRYANYLRDVPAYLIRTGQPAFIGLSRVFDHPSPRVEVRR